MASFKSTASSTFTAVTTTLDAAVKVVNTATVGIDMLHLYATEELADQKRGYKLNAAARVAEQIEEAKERVAQLKVRNAQFISKSELHAEAYASASVYIDAIAEEMGIKNLPTITVVKD